MDVRMDAVANGNNKTAVEEAGRQEDPVRSDSHSVSISFEGKTMFSQINGF